MPGSGTRTFLEPDRYEAGLRQTLLEAIVTSCGRFESRLTWAELHHLQLLRCEEEFPRIAYLVLPPRFVFVTFATDSSPTPLWDGTELQAGDVVLAARGQRLHQATRGPSIWSVIAIDPVQLNNYGRALSGKPFSPPEGRVLRASPRNVARLRRLHAQASRLAQTRPGTLTHPEVARAIEQDLIHALITCLTAAKVQKVGAAKHHHARVMIRFEEVLAQQIDRWLYMSDLCELIGVTDRTLRACCAEFLGTSPHQYMLLRRLKQVRIALRDADPDIGNVAALARGYGFTKLGRFDEVYCAVFGETPSATLQRAPRLQFARL